MSGGIPNPADDEPLFVEVPTSTERWRLTVAKPDGTREEWTPDPTDFPDPPPPDDPWRDLSLDRETVDRQLAELPAEWRPTPAKDAGPA